MKNNDHNIVKTWRDILITIILCFKFYRLPKRLYDTVIITDELINQVVEELIDRD